MKSTLNDQILTQVSTLKSHQKEEVLSFVQSLPKDRRHSKRYRTRALKEIRQALQEAI